jgi:hypothetical protein
VFQSKLLKEFSNKSRSKLYLWWIQTPLCDWYSDTCWKFFGQPISRIKKLYGWYVNVFKHDFDFDGHSLFAIIEYKLKRVQKSLNNGHATQETMDLKALKLAIKLAGRLKEDKYDELAHDRIEKKWGESKHWCEPCGDGSGNSYMRSSRPNIKNDEDKKQCHSDMMAEYEVAENKCKREERNLYAVLNKYLRRWWD